MTHKQLEYFLKTAETLNLTKAAKELYISQPSLSERIERLEEELGIDAWQGMEINDIPKLKAITGDKLAYHTTPDYQKYQAEELAGTLTEEDLRSRVRDTFYATAKNYCYCPMFLPFGGWSKDIMIDEIIADNFYELALPDDAPVYTLKKAEAAADFFIL